MFNAVESFIEIYLKHGDLASAIIVRLENIGGNVNVRCDGGKLNPPGGPILLDQLAGNALRTTR